MNHYHRDFNKFLYGIVNQFSVEEFAKFTNFKDILLTILQGKHSKEQLEDCIARNFKRNVPNKAVWIAGGFSSIKLTDEFYRSDSAERIFYKVFGVRKCSVDLEMEIIPTGRNSNANSVDSEIPVDSVNSTSKTVSWLPMIRVHALSKALSYFSVARSFFLQISKFQLTYKFTLQSNQCLSSGKKPKTMLREKYPRKVMFGSSGHSDPTKIELNVGMNSSVQSEVQSRTHWSNRQVDDGYANASNQVS